MKALVLGGGSILGAWEAGAARAVIESGFHPDIIIGISVGGLNGAYIANARGVKEWVTVGEALTDFWKHNISKPTDVVFKRRAVPLVWSIIRKKFNGFTSTDPIDDIIEYHIHLDNIRRSKIELSVGAINVNSGKIVYVAPHMPNFKDYLKATKAIPFAMPVQKIGLQSYIDGGLIDSAPIGEALKKGATEIVVVTPHPQDVGGAEINTGDIGEFAERCISIMQNNTLNNDIRIAELINSICPEDGSPIEKGANKGRKKVPITVIRPDLPISVSLNKFGKEDILMMLLTGMEKGKQIMGGNGGS